MSESPTDLKKIQCWMQAVIVHPQGVTAGLESAEARRYLDVSASDLEQWIAPSARQTSVERLSIYSYAYYARLLECLRSVFPTLAHALGEKAFDALAVAYLQQYPSRMYTLGELGVEFARFLEQTRPDAPAAVPNWPDLLIDLARLDWAIGEVFDGPGMEGKSTLTTAEIAAIPPDQWPDVRLTTAPCLRLLDFRFPVNAYFSAVRAGQSPRPPKPRDTYLALSRRDYIVQRHDLSRPQCLLLAALQTGSSIGESIARAAIAAEHADLAAFAQELRQWFADWTVAGFFKSADRKTQIA